ncbi:MAG: hypothetical protein QM777_25010 [Pseudorhodoferax sp.]
MDSPEFDQALLIQLPQGTLRVLVRDAQHAQQLPHADTRRKVGEIEDAVVDTAKAALRQRGVRIRCQPQVGEEVQEHAQAPGLLRP